MDSGGIFKVLTQCRWIFKAMQRGIDIFTCASINGKIDHTYVLPGHGAVFAGSLNLVLHAQFACGKKVEQPLVGLALGGIGPHTSLP